MGLDLQTFWLTLLRRLGQAVGVETGLRGSG
jgi:hypothetical protein